MSPPLEASCVRSCRPAGPLPCGGSSSGAAHSPFASADRELAAAPSSGWCAPMPRRHASAPAPAQVPVSGSGDPLAKCSCCGQATSQGSAAMTATRCPSVPTTASCASRSPTAARRRLCGHHTTGADRSTVARFQTSAHHCDIKTSTAGGPRACRWPAWQAKLGRGALLALTSVVARQVAPVRPQRGRQQHRRPPPAGRLVRAFRRCYAVCAGGRTAAGPAEPADRRRALLVRR